MPVSVVKSSLYAGKPELQVVILMTFCKVVVIKNFVVAIARQVLRSAALYSSVKCNRTA